MEEVCIQLARQARERAYCPYSGYAVGACLEAADGRRFCAGNVENASYGLSICAERSAVVQAVAAGAQSFTRIVVAAEGAVPYPCGACLQVLQEFGSDAMEVWVVNGEQVERTTLGALLPARFVLKEHGAKT